MRIYYCSCGIRTEVPKGVVKECECGKVFGTSGKISNYINMRNTLSGTTKMEFSTTTIDESIKTMKG
tara:strand:- start:7420 stop:7620 length:201 start_codon:yes stop_codon:yes gene_type:complete